MSSTVCLVLGPPGSRESSKPVVGHTWLNAVDHQIKLIDTKVRMRFTRKRQANPGRRKMEESGVEWSV